MDLNTESRRKDDSLRKYILDRCKRKAEKFHRSFIRKCSLVRRQLATWGSNLRNGYTKYK
jgi:hypothetical protein